MSDPPLSGVPGEVVRSKKPNQCVGCGLRLKEGHRRAPHETDFDATYVSASGSLVFRCMQCRTLTLIPLVDTTSLVDCRCCGQQIPDELQGSHVCESHPLGLDAEPQKEVARDAQ